MDAKSYFTQYENPFKRRYDALKDFHQNNIPAKEVAEKYGYTLSSFYSLSRDFNKHLASEISEDFFFKEVKPGRKQIQIKELDDMIIGLRKNNFSIEDIVGIVNSKGYDVSYGYVYSLLRKEGFARLPRRGKEVRQSLSVPGIKAPTSQQLDFLKQEKFHSVSTGIFLFLPIIKKYGIDKLILSSSYPQTNGIDRMASILSFIVLKLSNIKRYSDDDLWCMDRGLGLFAGLNVLPKNAWLSSYSSRVTPDMNVRFLKELHKVWIENDLLSDTVNLDFTTIPYRGDDNHLENNWSGKRNKALSSMLAVLAQDPDSGIIDYGNCDVKHENESGIVLEYLDFYKKDGGKQLRYLVFDSKFTNYQNLSKLDDEGVNFITIRRRGKRIVESIKGMKFKTIRVEAAGMKKRTLKVSDEIITLRGYYHRNPQNLKQIRQVCITGNGKIKPAFIILNDFDLPVNEVVRKYAKRWIVEKGISEQIDFFHLNRISSSMVIKVDFDFVMTILAYNLYRLPAMELDRYSNFTAERIYEKFIANTGNITVLNDSIEIELKKKRDLPLILQWVKQYSDNSYSWLNNKILNFIPIATS